MSDYTDDPYKELGVEPSADTATIKKAYRKLALQYHPDRAGGDTAKFARIANAYEILTDDHLRAEFDRSVDDDASSCQGEEDDAPSSNTKKKKTKMKSTKKKQSNKARPPFRYHFSDPYEVWKRDFKDTYGIDYPGAKYDWVAHEDSMANDFIDQHAKTNPRLQNGEPSSTVPTMLQNAPKEQAKPKRRGLASLFRRNKVEKESTPSSTALVPVSSSQSSALVPSNGSNSNALTVPGGGAPLDNSQALVATSGRNNRPVSMDVKTVQDGPVTITTTTLVRPDGSTETITMRSGLPGPAPKKNMALTNGETPKLALKNGDDTKALPPSKSTKKKEKKLAKKALKDNDQKTKKKDKKKALAIENGSKAIVPLK